MRRDMNQWDVIGKICEKLWNSEDDDCKAAEEYGFKENIIELLKDCYDYEDFCKWLARHECNPADGFRNAEVYEKSEYDSEEDWNEACDNALFSNDEYVCIYW